MKIPITNSKRTVYYSAAERRMQIEAVRNLWVNGVRNLFEMQRMLRARENAPLHLSRATIKKRVDAALQEMREEHESGRSNVGALRQSALKRLYRLKLQAEKKNDLKAALEAEKQIAQIEGTNEPVKVQVEEVQAVALRNILGSMSAADLVAEFQRAQEEQRELMTLRDLRQAGLLVDGKTDVDAAE